MGERIESKARRLYESGAVTLIDQNDAERKFEVEGDSGTYLVRWWVDEAWTCTCPSTTRCSHELAAILHWSDAHRSGNIMNQTEGMEDE